MFKIRIMYKLIALFYLIQLTSDSIQAKTTDTSEYTGLLNINYLDDRDTLIESIWIDSSHENFSLFADFKHKKVRFLKNVKGKQVPCGTFSIKDTWLMQCLKFEDLNGDGVYETMLGSGRNMNGNQWFKVFIYDALGDSIYNAGELNTDYKVDHKTQTIAETYEGSWYMEQTKTIYKWRGNNLVPEKMAVITGSDGSEKSITWFEYYTNPSHKPNGLTRTIRQKRNNKDARQKMLWDNFFKHN